MRFDSYILFYFNLLTILIDIDIAIGQLLVVLIESICVIRNAIDVRIFHLR